MSGLRVFLAVLGLAAVLGTAMMMPALAVQPDEMLSDPAQEARAREISKELRCLVCQNENIDDSNAALARDLRLLVRERITEGDSNPEVIAYLVERYGEFVLLKPRFGGANSWLWWAGPALFLGALILAGGYLRARSRATPETEAGLTPDEEQRLRDILKD